MDELDTLIGRLPKAELHLHIEGTLEPELMLALAARNGVRLRYASVGALRQAYSFSRLQDFLDLYYAGMSVLRTQADFHDLTAAYLARVQSQGLRYAEIFFDPQAHLSRGIAFEAVLDGLERAIEEARRAHGLEIRLILCFLRHLDEDDALRTLDLALAHKHRILGVGLDSSELGHPPGKFARVFRRAKDEGFRLTAHAGEEGPPEFVWQALDILGAERIDHGVRAMEDDALVQRLVRDQVALTVCPLSNLRLQVVKDLGAHPLKQMLDRGILATINSDDPAYFGGYLNENYAATARALGLAADEIRQIARNGFTASFLAPESKVDALAAFDAAGGLI